jgi:1-acyl-sn-glycerol-3-phosphate acyltransferase
MNRFRNPPGLVKRALAAGVERLVLSEMKKAFRAVHLCGDIPALDAHRPLVVFGNHHSFHDGYAMWYLARHVLNRHVTLWMEEWDRFPFFGAAGAVPFPSGDSAQRGRSMRLTRRRFDAHPASALVYFPEGRMHAAEEGILPWPEYVLPRLHGILGEPQWLPVALYSSWRAGDRPEIFIIPGELIKRPSGSERETLTELLERAPEASLEPSRIILAGNRSRNSTSFSFLAGYFRSRL